ncbi:MAG: 1,4-dihydroxy-6-naphtoate synthase [Planctomycetaceae bacterium]|nr:MAG: 1,4-dihydroxy-6-naphtoate synthase [Planctomycetaceae bacterium]
MLIRVGHSPDPDDAFMFHALANNKLQTGPYQFVHELQDIETLNRRALRGELELTAVSLHGYAYLTEQYALCRCGCSMGDGYGPMVVARRRGALSDWQGCRIAVPGTLTTAYLALRLALSDFEPVILPFDTILEAVQRGEVDAGLIIHEGQLTYARHQLHLICDLGVWWQQETGLPLPLGGNAIRRDLGPRVMTEVTQLLRMSIEYGLRHRAEALQHAAQYGRDLDAPLTDRFVSMYVNEWTLDFGPQGERAVHTLYRRAYDAGLLPHPVTVEFVG